MEYSLKPAELDEEDLKTFDYVKVTLLYDKMVHFKILDDVLVG